MAISTSALLVSALVLQSAQDMPRMQQHAHADTTHAMFERTLPGGWTISGMGQAFPIYTRGFTPGGGSPLDDDGFYLTQSAAMVNLESPERRLALRVTPNFEGLTQPDGELTFGAWGEGFIDSRHPHTVLHEAMLSVNLWGDGGTAASLSAGKGFAPFGTEDPMSRPVVKYPTNHHLSQVLERWTVNLALLRGPWGLEAGLFGGTEPEGPYDFSNISPFGDSWSVRASRRLGAESMGGWPWEISASFARIEETHTEAGTGAEEVRATDLFNAALRYEGPLRTGRAYSLLEGSVSDPREGEGYFSVLAEGRWSVGRHEPYVRLERATRPEYPREATTGDGFFRYDHDADAIGATAWSIASIGYGFVLTDGSLSIRPFVEAQAFGMARERGAASADALYGATRAYGLTFGARIFLGGPPMRMGAYGVLDPMTRMARTPAMAGMHD